MTAQRSDCYRHKRKEYSLVAITGDLRFNPREYGLKPVAICTACWRGYWCEFEVKASGLVLKNLYIDTKDGEWIEEPTKSEKHMGHREYKNINIPIDFTGKILLGNNFLSKYYIHMGFQRAYAYKELKEFVFEQGTLVETIDHSKMAKKIRQELEATCDDLSHPDGSNILKFVEDSFSTDYAVKAWWLDE